MKKQSVSLHTTLAEMIKEQADKRQFLDVLRVEQELLNFRNVDRPMDYIEGERPPTSESGLLFLNASTQHGSVSSDVDAACDNVEFLRLLRVACLQSVVSSGLRPKVLESYRRILLQSYGYQHMISLTNLEKLGLLCPQSGARNYAVLRKRLQLTLDDVDEQNPTDIAYVHSVYAPLTVRLLQHFAKPGWRSIRFVLRPNGMQQASIMSWTEFKRFLSFNSTILSPTEMCWTFCQGPPLRMCRPFRITYESADLLMSQA